MTQEEKLMKYREWLYNTQFDWEYEGMTEELAGLNAAIRKFEELGL